MNETRGNLEVRGYVHVGNRDLTPGEAAGMKREGLVRIWGSVLLWLLFPLWLCFVLGGAAIVTENLRVSDSPVVKVLMLLTVFALVTEGATAMTQGRRGRHLRADARIGVVNQYELRQVHPQQLPPYRLSMELNEECYELAQTQVNKLCRDTVTHPA